MTEFKGLNKESKVGDILIEAYSIVVERKDSSITNLKKVNSVLLEDNSRVKSERDNAQILANQNKEAANKYRKGFLYAGGIAALEFLYILFK